MDSRQPPKNRSLRCDSKVHYPNPCTRCRSRQLFCTIDAAFQRTPARKRLQAMSREIQELRSRQEAENVLSNSDPSTVHSTLDTLDTSENPADDDFGLYQDTVALDGTFVDSHLAIDAFRVFADEFRPQLPLLETISLHDMYLSKSFLFWTILVIVTSHSPTPTHQGIYRRLHDPYTKLLQKEALVAPLPLHKIQALLFLCTWPLPIEAQPKDPSWLYCGIAVQAARYMGLDREQPLPTTRSMGVTPGTRRARISAWLGCFYVATSLGLHLGLQPPVGSDLDFTAVHAFVAEKTISFDFATHVRIHLVVAKFTDVLLQNTSDVAGASLMRLVNGELETIATTFRDDSPGSLRLESAVLTAKLYLFALVITKWPVASSSRELTLQAGLTAAMRIVHMASQPSWSNGGDDPSSLQSRRALPKTYYRGVAFATFFLFTFFHLNAAASPEERQSAASHIAMAQSVFTACSVDVTDEYARAARMFELLARLPPGSADPGKLSMTHRLGVSIHFNATRMADEARGRPTDAVDGDEETNLFDSVGEMDPESLELLRQLGWIDPLMDTYGVDSMYGDQ